MTHTEPILTSKGPLHLVKDAIVFPQNQVYQTFVESNTNVYRLYAISTSVLHICIKFHVHVHQLRKLIVIANYRTKFILFDSRSKV